MKDKTKNVAEEFRKHGLKLTHQRLAVYETLLKSDEHPSAEEIYQSIKRDYPMLSRNTIYTTLETLKGLGLITEVSVWHKARYDANTDSHHHVVCMKCKKIDDVHDHNLDEIPIPEAIRERYNILSHKVEFYGTCSNCATLHQQTG
jgi:Fur family peroxide stress response transcriptional regulator